MIIATYKDLSHDKSHSENAMIKALKSKATYKDMIHDQSPKVKIHDQGHIQRSAMIIATKSKAWPSVYQPDCGLISVRYRLTPGALYIGTIKVTITEAMIKATYAAKSNDQSHIQISISKPHTKSRIQENHRFTISQFQNMPSSISKKTDQRSVKQQWSYPCWETCWKIEIDAEMQKVIPSSVPHASSPDSGELGLLTTQGKATSCLHSNKQNTKTHNLSITKDTWTQKYSTTFRQSRTTQNNQSSRE